MYYVSNWQQQTSSKKNILLIKKLKAILIGILNYCKKFVIYVFKTKLLSILLCLILSSFNIYYSNTKS